MGLFQGQALASPGSVAGVTRALETMSLLRIVTVFSKAENRVCGAEDCSHADCHRKCQCGASTVPSPESSLPLGGVLQRRDDLGSAQRTARRRWKGGEGDPREELSDSWARSSLPCRRALSPTASLRKQQPWDLAGCWVLGARSGVAPAILILQRETEKQGPWELGGQRPEAGAGPEW